MSEPLQLGQHPDADQLSAFAERALPAHEQEQTLAHLATCSDCRQVVALSLPPIEGPPLDEPEPIREPWFGGWFLGWRLVWIAAPALAAILVLTIYIRTTAIDRRHPAQVAQSHPPLPQAVVPQDRALQALKPAPSSKASASARAAKARKPSPSREVPADDSSPVNGRELALDKVAPPPAQSIGGPIRVNGAVAGMASGMGAAPARNAAGAAQQVPAAAPSASFFVRSAPPAQPQAAPSANAPQTAASAPTPDAIAASPALTASLSDRPIATYAPHVGKANSLAASSTLRKSGFVSVLAPLPSGQSVLSFAAYLHKFVAIDAHNTLFYSEDDGRHWKPVSPQWQGRVVAVAMAAPVASHPSSLSFSVPERFAAGALTSAQITAYPDAPGSSLSGTVTDTSGAVVAGATVVVKETRYALVRTEKADATGHYLFANLAPGTYRIDAQAPGFVMQALAEEIGPSQQAVRNLVLSVGQAAETVTVDAVSVQLETQSRTSAAEADKAEVVQVRPASKEHPPIFVLTTESGDRWVSSDGQSWKHE